MPAPRCHSACTCGKHRRALLNRADLEVLRLVFGFPSIEEFNVFLYRMDARAEAGR